MEQLLPDCQMTLAVCVFFQWFQFHLKNIIHRCKIENSKGWGNITDDYYHIV